MKETVPQMYDDVKHDIRLQSACEKMYQNFPGLFKPELDCLKKDFALEVLFKMTPSPFFVHHDQYLLHCKMS